MRPLTKQQFIEVAVNSKRICLHEEVACDHYTPISIFLALSSQMSGATILESGIHDSKNGRYSFLGLDPIAQLIVKDKHIVIKENNVEKILHGEVLTLARQYLKKYQCTYVHPLAKFIGGTAGFVSYDAVRLFEDIPDRHTNKGNLPDFIFNFYRISLTFDHLHQKLIIAVAVDISEDAALAYDQARQELQSVIDALNQAPIKTRRLHNVSSDSIIDESEITDHDFIDLVNKAKQYIAAGDAFQIVLSRRFIKDIKVTPFEIYRALRYRSPAPYMFYIDQGDTVILGASPEKLVSLEDDIVSITPIAGTRVREENQKDEEISLQLLADEKESAEHMMLVDLARNDIGFVCEPGSVKVIELMQSKVFSHVIHLVSLVQGKLNQKFDALDILAKAFPAGTLAGAPKIRAMQIIDELESSRRGIYGGAVFFIDCLGNLESCIAIRMAVIKNQQAIIQAGAGIVFDSDPLMEAQETKHKARSVLDAIRMAEEGVL